jgi:hypothetical protein
MYYLRFLLLILLLPVIACDRATDAIAPAVGGNGPLSQIPSRAPLVNVGTNQIVPTKPLSRRSQSGLLQLLCRSQEPAKASQNLLK